MTDEITETFTSVALDALFEPYEFGNVTLPNRIVMAPMTRSHSPGNFPNDDNVAYYRRRAEGGVGLIITEGTMPDHPSASGYPNVPTLYGDKAMAGWKRVVDEVHDAGGFIIPQIWHTGSIRKVGTDPHPEAPSMGPSAVMHPSFNGKGEVPQAMTQQDIDDAVAGYARSAALSREAGFDGLELHGAHSYLIDQFFWEATNLRDDKYGGDLLQRATFGVEVVEAVRKAVGDDFPIVFRYSQWKQGDYEHKMAKTPEELDAFLALLSNAGVDYFHASNRRFGDAEFEGSDLNLAGWSKKLTKKPSITVGSVGLDSDFLRSYAGKEANKAGLDDLIRRLEAKEFDLVAVGRALLSDPEWANKVKEGREEEIVTFTREYMKIYH